AGAEQQRRRGARERQLGDAVHGEREVAHDDERPGEPADEPEHRPRDEGVADEPEQRPVVLEVEDLPPDLVPAHAAATFASPRSSTRSASGRTGSSAGDPVTWVTKTTAVPCSR